MIKPQAGHLTGINKQVQAYHPPHRLNNTNTQADSHTCNTENISSQPYRRKNYNRAATQATKLRACCHTGNKTTSLPPHRRNTKPQAYSHTGKNYKLAAAQASYKTTSLPSHMQPKYKL